MGKKFTKRTFTTQEISDIVEKNKGLKSRNRKVIQENKSFLDSANSFQEEVFEESDFLPKKKVNEKHREAIIDSIFNEEDISFSNAFKTPQNKFIVIYDNAQVLKFNGKVAYQLREKLRINLRGEYLNYKITKT